MSDNSTCRTIGQFIQALNDGDFAGDASTELKDLVASLSNCAMENGGKAKGRLTLTFDFALDKGSLDVTADLAVKTPKLARGRSVFWATPDNFLTRRNPRQVEMELRTVTPRSDEPARTA